MVLENQDSASRDSGSSPSSMDVNFNNTEGENESRNLTPSSSQASNEPSNTNQPPSGHPFLQLTPPPNNLLAGIGMWAADAGYQANREPLQTKEEERQGYEDDAQDEPDPDPLQPAQGIPWTHIDEVADLLLILDQDVMDIQNQIKDLGAQILLGLSTAVIQLSILGETLEARLEQIDAQDIELAKIQQDIEKLRNEMAGLRAGNDAIRHRLDAHEEIMTDLLVFLTRSGVFVGEGEGADADMGPGNDDQIVEQDASRQTVASLGDRPDKEGEGE